MMIRELSDIHLEFIRYAEDVRREAGRIIPELPTDSETVLIIAGDIGSTKRITALSLFIDIVCARFKHVIYVLGNHEHYWSDISMTENTLRGTLTNSNLTIAGNFVQTVVIDGITFHAATLWTDYKKSPDEMKAVASRFLNDHRYIKDGPDLFTPDKAQKIHASCKRKLAKLMKGKDNSKTVIITHHLPTYKAVHPKYGDDPLNGAFASDLDAFILKHQPAYWFFGHTHDAYNGTIGTTQLVCNPVGYPNEQIKNNGFHPSNVFTI